MAFVKFYTNHYDEAVEEFKTVLKSEPFDVSIYYYIAKAYVELSNDILVKEYFEHSLKENPGHIISYLDYSQYLIDKNEYQEAQRKLRRALKIDENNVEILNLLFHVSYVLVKENVCEYNVKEALSIAEKICSINKDSFRYEEEKADLEKILNS